MFDKKGYIVVDKGHGRDEEKLMAAALDAGADDLHDDGDNWEVFSAPDVFQPVHEAVKQLGIEPGAAEVAMLPQNYVKLEGKPAQQMVKLMEALEDHDDTQEGLVELRHRGEGDRGLVGVRDLRDRSRLGAHRLRLRRDRPVSRHQPRHLRIAVRAARCARFPTSC